MFRALELAGDAGDIVVSDEGQRRKAVEEPGVTLQRVIQLEEVAVVESAPDRFP